MTITSQQLKSYLTGLILGDGFIDNGVNKRAFRIKSINTDFIESIYEAINKTTNFKVSVKEFPNSIGRDGTNHRKYQELTISSHPYFSKIYHLFYDDYRKRILTKKAIDSLGWEGWANWFMSDGYICKVGKESGKIVDRRVDLCTDRYSKKDVEYLSSFISKKYGYKTKVFNRGNSYRIRMSLMDAQYFLLNISPFVVPSFYYKLDMSYDYRPTWMTDEYYQLMISIQSASLREIG